LRRKSRRASADAKRRRTLRERRRQAAPRRRTAWRPAPSRRRSSGAPGDHREAESTVRAELAEERRRREAADRERRGPAPASCRRSRRREITRGPALPTRSPAGLRRGSRGTEAPEAGRGATVLWSRILVAGEPQRSLERGFGASAGLVLLGGVGCRGATATRHQGGGRDGGLRRLLEAVLRRGGLGCSADRRQDHGREPRPRP
jgi:hypothetical protein